MVNGSHRIITGVAQSRMVNGSMDHLPRAPPHATPMHPRTRTPPSGAVQEVQAGPVRGQRAPAGEGLTRRGSCTVRVSRPSRHTDALTTTLGPADRRHRQLHRDDHGKAARLRQNQAVPVAKALRRHGHHCHAQLPAGELVCYHPGWATASRPWVGVAAARGWVGWWALGGGSG
jgi:hypothetical protein